MTTGTPTVTTTDLTLPDGRVLRVHDAGGPPGALPVVYHHGTPNVGVPPLPVVAAAQGRGLRLVGLDRPGYGGSTPRLGRRAVDLADDVAALADDRGWTRLGQLSHSGGGAYALACRAVLGDRVVATAVLAGPAPYDADGLDFEDGLAPAGVAEHRASLAGREAILSGRADAAGDEELDPGFTEADGAALGGRWAWFLDVVRPALAGPPEGHADDRVSAVTPWGFDPGVATSPLLLVHGGLDRVVPAGHARWLASRSREVELRERHGDGHVTVMDSLLGEDDEHDGDEGDGVLAWLASTGGAGGPSEPPAG